MTSVAAPLPLPEQWTSQKNGAQVECRGTPIVHKLYQTYDPPSDAPHEGQLHQKYCRTRRPKVNRTILSQIESPHPAIKLDKSQFSPETITFEEYNAKQPCLVYPWDPRFDPLYTPDVDEGKYSTVFNPSCCGQLPNITNRTPID